MFCWSDCPKKLSLGASANLSPNNFVAKSLVRAPKWGQNSAFGARDTSNKQQTSDNKQQATSNKEQPTINNNDNHYHSNNNNNNNNDDDDDDDDDNTAKNRQLQCRNNFCIFGHGGGSGSS